LHYSTTRCSYPHDLSMIQSELSWEIYRTFIPMSYSQRRRPGEKSEESDRVRVGARENSNHQCSQIYKLSRLRDLLAHMLLPGILTRYQARIFDMAWTEYLAKTDSESHSQDIVEGGGGAREA
jgi:hypothetical protein